MFFLGLDPGYHRLGYGIISYQKADSFPKFETCGVIETSNSLSDGARLSSIYSRLSALAVSYSIYASCVEEVFFKKNLTTGVKLIQARGVILLMLNQKNILVHEVAPTTVKKMITTYGGADKKQVQLMTKRILHLDELPKPDDAADGLSLALCAWLHFKNTL